MFGLVVFKLSLLIVEVFYRKLIRNDNGHICGLQPLSKKTKFLLDVIIIL